MIKKKKLYNLLILLCLILFYNCGLFEYIPSVNYSNSVDDKPIPVYKVWTWISGSDKLSQPGSYGTKGIPNSKNAPGGRGFGVSWRDNLGNLWLFGGSGFDSTSTEGNLNDLWKFDGTNWTWITGSNLVNQNGIYGIKGIADPANVPGSRSGCLSWKDSQGNLWLFGGSGLDHINLPGNEGYLNDLWKFDGTNWTWVSGSDTKDQSGIYGEKGVAGSSNIPGGRCDCVGWTDNNGNFWLFGGWGLDNTEEVYMLNDLWKFDGTNWTWISGSDTGNQTGYWGLKGIPSSSNMPSSRRNCVGWCDSANNLWLFGGLGLDSYGINNSLNDLWKFDGTMWIWISGSNVRNQRGVYGVKGIPHIDNTPGGRYNAVCWADNNQRMWLFGGYGYDEAGSNNYLNDLWRFDGSNWTWISGSNLVRQNGIYGIKGIAGEDNVPGSRDFCYTWADNNGYLYLLGGWGYASVSSGSLCRALNDMWKYNTNENFNIPSNINSVIKINGTTFDGQGRTFYPSGLEQSYNDGPGPVFMVTNGTIKNFTLAPPTFEGIWFYGNCIADNITLHDTNEKAITIKKPGVSTISNFTANNAPDNVIQINDQCTITCYNIKCNNINKMVRQNGMSTWKCVININETLLSGVNESIVRSDSLSTTVRWRNINCNLAQSSWWYGNFIVDMY